MKLDNVENLVFSGGGVRGVAFLGALMSIKSWCCGSGAVCEDSALPSRLLPNLKRCAGSSVGAMFAVTTALRLESETIFKSIEDDCLLDSLLPEVNINHLMHDYGLDDGERLKEGILRILEIGMEKWGIGRGAVSTITMSDLKSMTGIDVLISTTLIGAEDNREKTLPKSVILSATNTPDLHVYQAIAMSMSVPMLYKPVSYGGNLYVDGALLDNCPITADMEPDRTLLMRLQTKEFDKSDGFQSYLSTVIYCPLFWTEEQKAMRFTKQIKVTSGSITTFKFGARREELIAAILEGMVCGFVSLRNST